MLNYPADQRFWVLDFDRCLGNVDVLFAHYTTVLYEYHRISQKDLLMARRNVEESKGSFDLISYLLDSGMVSKTDLRQLDAAFIALAANDPAVRMPGASNFLLYLESEYNGQYGIMTYGNPQWQRSKIAAAGLSDIPLMIVDSPYKARQIVSWYDDVAKEYKLPIEMTNDKPGQSKKIREIILVDDKRIAFEGMQGAMKGYLVGPQKNEEVSTSVKKHIQYVNDLGDIIAG